MYSTSTQREPLDSEAHIFDFGKGKRQQTVLDIEVTHPWNVSRPVARTDGEIGRGAELQLRVSTKVAVQPAMDPVRVNSIRGTVASIEERSIFCELSSGERTVTVALLPELFPEMPEFGQTFTLEMEERGGFQQPIITFLDPVSVEDELTLELDRLLAR